jgi:hypothetical protein
MMLFPFWLGSLCGSGVGFFAESSPWAWVHAHIAWASLDGSCVDRAGLTAEPSGKQPWIEVSGFHDCAVAAKDAKFNDTTFALANITDFQPKVSNQQHAA